MSAVHDVLGIAKGEVGYVESGGTTGRNGNVTKYWAELEPTYQGEPWCAAFVSWVFKHAGHPLPKIDHDFGFTYCPDAVAYAKANGLWDESGHYRPGDVALFCFDGSGVAEHVGIVVSDNGSVITTIEGNTSSGNYGSQANGGGVYLRKRPHGPTVLGVLATSRVLHGEKRKPHATKAVARNVRPSEQAHPAARLAVDGDFGPLTVKALQRALGVKPTGVFDKGTKLVLQSHLNASVRGCDLALTGRVNRATVKALQKRVHARRDGVWGPKTTRHLQRRLNAHKF